MTVALPGLFSYPFLLFCHCLCMYVLVKLLVWIARSANLFGKLSISLSACFDCGVFALSGSFFPFDVLQRKLLGNCIDSFNTLISPILRDCFAIAFYRSYYLTSF